jgi:hypothetical protein
MELVLLKGSGYTWIFFHSFKYNEIGMIGGQGTSTRQKQTEEHKKTDSLQFSTLRLLHDQSYHLSVQDFKQNQKTQDVSVAQTASQLGSFPTTTYVIYAQLKLRVCLVKIFHPKISH